MRPAELLSYCSPLRRKAGPEIEVVEVAVRGEVDDDVDGTDRPVATLGDLKRLGVSEDEPTGFRVE
jgi:hypothetical protein